MDLGLYDGYSSKELSVALSMPVPYQNLPKSALFSTTLYQNLLGYQWMKPLKQEKLKTSADMKLFEERKAI